MAYQFQPDVEKLIQQYMTTGGYASQDELLRDAFKALDYQCQTIVHNDPEVVAGIGRGLDEMRQGLGRPFEEFDAEFREKSDPSNDG